MVSRPGCSAMGKMPKFFANFEQNSESPLNCQNGQSWNLKLTGKTRMCDNVSLFAISDVNSGS